MLYFRTSQQHLPEIAYLTIDEANKFKYGEILNGKKLTAKERIAARENGNKLRTSNIILVSLEQY